MSESVMQPSPKAMFRFRGSVCAIGAAVMGCGWVYRGTVGHEYGAMVPAALLGLSLCLASRREDWHRRAAAAGLFAAIGWSWGGSVSYMEHTFYVLSASFPDVVYGYSALFLIGALWAGCGAAVLGLALTESRSHLECLIRPFAAVCVLYGVFFLWFTIFPEHNEAYETLTVIHFHDGDWLSATLTLVGAAVYWLVRPNDRHGAVLLFCGALAWWAGYGLLTRLGGLRLAPLHRSESWGGVLGILAVLMVYLIRRQNRAALMMCLYGCLGGGLAFVMAVLVRHPLAVRWEPLANMGLQLPQWRTAELTFGLLTGMVVALAAVRMLRGGIAAAEENRPTAPLDVFSVFVLLVVLPWINVRRHTDRVLRQTPATDDLSFLGLSAGIWYVISAGIVTAAAVHLLHRYLKGDREHVPQTAFGKGLWVVLLMIWFSVAVQLLDDRPSRASLTGHLCLWIPAAVSTWLLVRLPGSVAVRSMSAATGIPITAGVSCQDARWRVGRRFFLACALVPGVIVGAAGVSLKMQNGEPDPRGRLRFGPDAYWRRTARLLGRWEVVGMASAVGDRATDTQQRPVTWLEFTVNRDVRAELPDGTVVVQHRWFLKNQYIWLHWYGRSEGHSDQATVPLIFHDQRLYIAWPPAGHDQGYLVMQRR